MQRAGESRYRTLVLTCGLCVTSACLAAAPAPPPDDGLNEPSDVWGDPGASPDDETGWTWFGMGYERRMRGNQDAAPADAAETKLPGGDGGGKSGK
ncbi:MAG: hypothetical protein KDJ27_16905 [Gammaproteobacteria bacterium]|nr:hypothetical protein [Gammaproteobacteria bacterium]